MSEPLGSTSYTANGIQFACLEAGTGPLVLCLHGFPDTPHTYTGLIKHLAAQGFRVVAPYLRGYPPNTAPADGDYSPLALAQDALALMDGIGCEKASLIGHDWGAFGAYLAANLAPDRVERLVLMSVPHQGGDLRPTFAQLRRSWYILFFQLRGLAEARVARKDFAFIDRLYRAWSPNWAFTKEDLEPVKRTLAAPGGLRAALGYYRCLFSRRMLSIQPLLRQQTAVSTLYMAGEQDGAVGPEQYEGIERAFSAPLDFELLPSVGHFPHREMPDYVERRIAEFLAHAGKL